MLKGGVYIVMAAAALAAGCKAVWNGDAEEFLNRELRSLKIIDETVTGMSITRDPARSKYALGEVWVPGGDDPESAIEIQITRGSRSIPKTLAFGGFDGAAGILSMTHGELGTFRFRLEGFNTNSAADDPQKPRTGTLRMLGGDGEPLAVPALDESAPYLFKDAGGQITAEFTYNVYERLGGKIEITPYVQTYGRAWTAKPDADLDDTVDGWLAFAPGYTAESLVFKGIYVEHNVDLFPSIRWDEVVYKAGNPEVEYPGGLVPFSMTLARDRVSSDTAPVALEARFVPAEYEITAAQAANGKITAIDVGGVEYVPNTAGDWDAKPKARMGDKVALTIEAAEGFLLKDGGLVWESADGRKGEIAFAEDAADTRKARAVFTMPPRAVTVTAEFRSAFWRYIEITTVPSKKDYDVGDTLDQTLDGLVAFGIRNDGPGTRIQLNKSDIKVINCEGADKNESTDPPTWTFWNGGRRVVTIELYDGTTGTGLTATFAVTVNAGAAVARRATASGVRLYKTLDAALNDAAASDDTVTLIAGAAWASSSNISKNVRLNAAADLTLTAAGGVTVESGATLTLGGGGVTGTLTLVGVITVAGGFILEHGAVAKGAVTMTGTGKVTIRGGELEGGVMLLGDMTMEGGAIHKVSGGPGVNMVSGTFTMKGGAIYDGTGNGVALSAGTFTMTGGAIYGNEGNGVTLSNGTFTMKGGAIYGNGVNGVTLTNGTFAMEGGAIYGNTGDGVALSGGGVFTMSGAAYVAPGNKVSLGAGKMVTVGAKITSAQAATLKPSGSGPFLVGTQIVDVATSLTGKADIAASIAAFTADGLDPAQYTIERYDQTTLGTVREAVATRQSGGRTTGYTALYSGEADAPGAIDAALAAGGSETVSVRLDTTIGKALTVNKYLTLKAAAGKTPSVTMTAQVTVDAGITLALSAPSAPTGAGLTFVRGAGFTGTFFDVKGALAAGGDGSVTLSGGIPTSQCEPLVTVTGNGNFTLKSGATISGNKAQKGGGVLVSGGSFTMEGGAISGNEATAGGGVFVESGKTFKMSGGEIRGNTSIQYGGGVIVEGTFTIEGGATISGNKTPNGTGGGVYVVSGKTFTMTGGTISGNEAKNGGGVYNGGTFTMSGTSAVGNNTATVVGGGVYNMGTFTMSGGTIGGAKAEDKNTATDGGGGVYDNGSFTMSGGEILGNEAQNGGGVYVPANKIFTMTGGEIAGNTATLSGGGVYNMETFTMEGGTIGGNTAQKGGGVYNEGGFTMSGGTIGGSDTNTATIEGGGVYNSSGTFTMEGGAIGGNTAAKGGGVYNNGTLKMEGGATVDTGNDVHLAIGTTIKLNSALTGTGTVAKITPSAAYSAGTEVLSESSSGLIAAHHTRFAVTQNATDYWVVDSTGKLCLPQVVNSGDLSARITGLSGGATETFMLSGTGEQPVNLTISNNADVTLLAEPGSAIELISASSSAIIEVSGGGKLTLGGGGGTLILDGKNSTTSLVKVDNNGTLTINDGAVLQNGSAGAGGAVSVVSGTLNMTGGEIYNNSAANSAGIDLDGGDFFMSGGKIHHNSCVGSSTGGGVQIRSGTMTMTGGEIYNNSAKFGGGVRIADGATLNINSPAITSNIHDNTSTNGAPHNVLKDGSFKVNGVSQSSGY